MSSCCNVPRPIPPTHPPKSPRLCFIPQWKTLIPPTKCPVEAGDRRFSGRLESSRKDVECFFGIVKGRFRICKLAIQYLRQKDLDSVFFTCCILHNMLHSFDNNGEMVEEPNWTGSAGLHNAWDQDPLTDFTSVGAKDAETEVEVEDGFVATKQKLITSFVYREKKGDITWLKRR